MSDLWSPKHNKGRKSKPRAITLEEFRRIQARIRELSIKPDRFGDLYFCAGCWSFGCQHAVQAGEADAN